MQYSRYTQLKKLLKQLRTTILHPIAIYSQLAIYVWICVPQPNVASPYFGTRRLTTSVAILTYLYYSYTGIAVQCVCPVLRTHRYTVNQIGNIVRWPAYVLLLILMPMPWYRCMCVHECMHVCKNVVGDQDHQGSWQLVRRFNWDFGLKTDLDGEKMS